MTISQFRGEINPLSIKTQPQRMKLYHFEVGFPKWFKTPQGVVKPEYGGHSRMEAMADRYGKIQLPTTIDLSKYKVIEVGEEDGKVVKMVIRGSLDNTRDICIVITNTGFVKTVWVNLKNDTHRTLDRTKYIDPKGM